jgi:hypothetical protein
MTETDESERMWEETEVVCLDTISWYFPADAEDNHENLNAYSRSGGTGTQHSGTQATFSYAYCFFLVTL